MFSKMCINCLVLGQYIHNLFMSQVEISTTIVSTKEAMPFKDAILLSTVFILLKT